MIWTKITTFGPVDLAQWRQVALYASNNPKNDHFSYSGSKYFI